MLFLGMACQTSSEEGQGKEGGTTLKADSIKIAVEKAFAYLQKAQEQDGSWPYFSGKDRALGKRYSRPQPRLGGNIKTLLNLKNTPYEQSDLFRKGLAYVTSLKEDTAHFWAYDGKHHEYSNYHVKINEILTGKPLDPNNLPLLEPDTDATSTALILLGEQMELSKRDYESIKQVYDKYLHQGLYRTFLDDYYGERGWWYYDYDRLPSIGVNVVILGFFEKYDLPYRDLMAGIDQYLTNKQYFKRPDYYTSLPILASMALDNVEEGALQSKKYVKRFLRDYERLGMEVGMLVNTELAAYIRAKVYVCQEEGGDCSVVLREAVKELLDRQNREGYWKAAGAYEAGYFPQLKGKEYKHHEYYGSEAETTAYAIKALWTYRASKMRE